MEELLRLLLGIFVLILGIPIGNFIKKLTLDEQKDGQKWFKLLTLIGLIGGFTGLLIKEDWVLFTFFFIAIVSSKNLQKKKRR